MAAEITGTNAWTGVPVAVGALGTALASWPLSRLMARFGRRPGLAVGYGLAVVGAELAMAAVLMHSFPLLLLGMTLFGIANTSNLLARYAAADVSPGAQRGRAMGLIVWGSTAGSIIGPNLMGLAVQVGRPLGLSPAGSAFLISVAGLRPGPALVVQVLLRPDPLAIAAAAPRAAWCVSCVAERVRSLGDDPDGPAGAHRARHAHDEPARDDRHDVDVAGVSPRPGAPRRHHRARGGGASGRDVHRLPAVRLALATASGVCR